MRSRCCLTPTSRLNHILLIRRESGGRTDNLVHQLLVHASIMVRTRDGIKTSEECPTVILNLSRC